MKHGTRYGYTQALCRCGECRAWNAANQREVRRRRKERGGAPNATPTGFTHGTGYGYRVKRCRCSECRAWNAALFRRQHRQRQERRQVVVES